jgi:enoyl-CoA hydratase/carnithine racemase
MSATACASEKDTGPRGDLMASDARREDGDGIITVTFTREAKRNAVTPSMWDVLRQAVRDLGDDDAQRVLVITAEGSYLTSGFDFEYLRPNVGEGTDGVVRGSNIRRQYRAEAYHDLFDEMESIEKPIIHAAQGHCVGVGVEMGASCDFRFAAANATFALPEIANIATLPGSGGISRLTRVIGPHWAKWLVMACETIDAEQAKDIGLVHRVFPRETFHDKVREFAVKLCSMPREAMGLAKVTIDAANTIDRRTARELDRMAQTTLFMSDEYKDRVHAFTTASTLRNTRQGKLPDDGVDDDHEGRN